jgi:hypothetical protein
LFKHITIIITIGITIIIIDAEGFAERAIVVARPRLVAREQLGG